MSAVCCIGAQKQNDLLRLLCLNRWVLPELLTSFRWREYYIRERKATRRSKQRLWIQFWCLDREAWSTWILSPKLCKKRNFPGTGWNSEWIPGISGSWIQERALLCRWHCDRTNFVLQGRVTKWWWQSRDMLRSAIGYSESMKNQQHQMYNICLGRLDSYSAWSAGA